MVFSMDVIKKYCQRVAYLKNGVLEYLGDPETAVSMYIAENQ